MILLKNGCIHTMEQDFFKNGYLLIDGAKISAVGDMKDLKDVNADQVYDLEGAFVMPGMVDGHSHIGMWEDSLGFEGADGNEETDPVTPQLRAIDAVNPMDKCFEEGLCAGVTTSVTGPGSANVIGGQFAALKMRGTCIDDMIIKAPVAVKAALGENPKGVYHDKNQAPMTRMATAALLRETLFKAKEYGERLEKFKADPLQQEKPEFQMKYHALLPVLSGELPMKVHVHRADDMFTAVRIAKEFGIRITLEHATEAHLVAEKVIGLPYPLLLGPNFCDRSKPELKNLDPKAAGILERNGIRPALITDHPVIPCQHITICAALAVKHGMSEQAALEAITINPARYCGIDGRVGSLKAGKDADIAVFTGNPLHTGTAVRYVFLNGKLAVKDGAAESFRK